MIHSKQECKNSHFLRKIKNNYIGSEFPHKIKHLHTLNLSHFRNPPIFSETHFLTTHIYSDKRAEYSTRFQQLLIAYELPPSWDFQLLLKAQSPL